MRDNLPTFLYELYKVISEKMETSRKEATEASTPVVKASKLGEMTAYASICRTIQEFLENYTL